MADSTPRDDRLAALLERSAERAEQLAELLRAEHEALAGGTAQAIADAAHAKQPLIEEFERLGEHLGEALRTVGLEGSDDLDRAIARAPDGPVAASLRRLLAALGECRHANTRNGAAIRQLARHNRHLLSLVRGETPGAALYDNDGQARRGPLSRYAASA